MSQTPSDVERPSAPEDEELYCYGHPKTPTKLRCSRCERPICGRCAIPASVGQHCPECVAEARRTTRQARGTLAATAPATMGILILNGGFFVAQWLIPGFTEKLILDPILVQQGEWYRLLTAIVLHSPGFVFHILMNSFVLFSFGPNVEQAFGKTRFIVMYLASGFLASAFSYAFPPLTRSLGASGAIFGVIGVLLVYLHNRRSRQFVRESQRSVLTFVGINLVLGFLIRFVDNWAHIGGLVGGIVLGLGFDRPRNENEVSNVVIQVLTVALIVALGIALITVVGPRA